MPPSGLRCSYGLPPRVANCFITGPVQPCEGTSLPDGERRLAAIMFTDMVGYTLLGQKNESLSLALVEEQRKLIRPILGRHSGKEIKTMGDAFLVEFPSALDAVRCAYDIQRATREFNITLPSEKRVHLRVGVHLGDVVESQGDISGDAVNVASRIQPLAEDGGVCLTQQVYDHVQNKFELPLESLGNKSLKNVSVPLEVYKMVMPWSEEKTNSSPRLDKSRIAILPFASMSSDPEDEYFADGMTEELISTTSSIAGLTLIARTSVMGYKGTTKKVEEIGKELSVGTVLEGSVRKAGKRLRITVQLIDVQSQGHLWAQSYDKELDDVFALQTEIARSVADSLKVKIHSKEEGLIDKKPTQDLEAHELYLKGLYQWNKRTKEAIHKAIECFQQAIERDPGFALAYSGMAECYGVLPGFDASQPEHEALLKAKELSMKALELDDTLAEAHTALAGSLQGDWDWKGAEREYERAIELNPSYATAHQWHGNFLMWYSGRFEDAIKELRRATELDPLSPIIGVNFAEAYMRASRLDDAIVQCKKVLDMEPNFSGAHGALMSAYLLKSMYREAIDEAESLIRLMPEDAWAKSALGCVYGLAGMQERAKEILGEMLELSKKQYVPPTVFIELYFSIGDTDKAYDWMQKAYDEHGTAVPILRWDPFTRKVWADPRFLDFMKRVGLG